MYQKTDGTVADKSNRLVLNSNGSYSNPHNDVSVTYPACINEGITLNYNGTVLKVTPTDNTENSSVIKSNQSDASVAYKNGCGDNTVLQYIQTYSGYKENILLTKCTNRNTFSFTVETNDASIEKLNGVVGVSLINNKYLPVRLLCTEQPRSEDEQWWIIFIEISKADLPKCFPEEFDIYPLN